MTSLNRLSCEIIDNCLYVEIAGEICSGDLINFSYRIMRQLDKMAKGDIIYFEASSAKLNLLEGLWQKIVYPFIEKAQETGIRKIAFNLSPFLFEKHEKIGPIPRTIRLFNGQSTEAKQWLDSTEAVEDVRRQQ